MARKHSCRRIQKIAWRTGLASSYVKCPLARRWRLERQIDGASHVTDIDRVVELVAALGHQPLLPTARLFDELAVKRKRSMPRLFAGTIDGNITERDEFN